MRPRKFRALVDIDPAADQEWNVHSTAHQLVVRAGRQDAERAFNASVAADDQEPLRAGDTDRMVTITVADDDAIEILTPGEQFELWGRHRLGHGVVSRRVVV